MIDDGRLGIADFDGQLVRIKKRLSECLVFMGNFYVSILGIKIQLFFINDEE